MKKTISSSLENLVIRKRDFYYVQETLNGSSRAFSKLTGFTISVFLQLECGFFIIRLTLKILHRMFF